MFSSLSSHLLATALSFALAVFGSTASAADGDPDLTFGLVGAVAFPFDDGGPATNDIGFAVHELPDGKILGFFRRATVTPAGREDLVIMRVQANGDPDPSFGSDGRVNLPLGYFSLADALVDSQGRMLIAGSSPINTTSFSSLIRLLPDGSPDTSFSGDGFSGIDWGNTFDGPARLMIASDDSIWMTGSLGDPAVNQDLYVAKFSSITGGLIFGSYLRMDVVSGGRDFGTGLVEDSSGRILVLGSSCFSALACSGVIMRISANGALDTSFAAAQTPRCRYNQVGAPTAGCGLFALSGARELFHDGVELPNGDLLMAGLSRQDGQASRGLLIAATANGSGLVPENQVSFRSGPLGTEFRRIAQDAEGRFVVAGAGGAMRVVDLAGGGFDPTFSSSPSQGGQLAPSPRIDDIGPGVIGVSFNAQDQIYLAGSLFRANGNQRDGYLGRLGPVEVRADEVFIDGFE